MHRMVSTSNVVHVILDKFVQLRNIQYTIAKTRFEYVAVLTHHIIIHKKGNDLLARAEHDPVI